jgi:hypothetical protein
MGGLVGLRVDGFRLVALFVFLGWNVPEEAVESVVVIPIDPFESDFLDVVNGLQ